MFSWWWRQTESKTWEVCCKRNGEEGSWEETNRETNHESLHYWFYKCLSTGEQTEYLAETIQASGSLPPNDTSPVITALITVMSDLTYAIGLLIFPISPAAISKTNIFKAIKGVWNSWEIITLLWISVCETLNFSGIWDVITECSSDYECFSILYSSLSASACFGLDDLSRGSLLWLFYHSRHLLHSHR